MPPPPDPLRYVVVGMRRSGTTVTHYCLRGHPNVSALYSEVSVEPFFSQGIKLFSFGQGGTDHEISVGHRVLFDAAAGIEADEHTTALGMKAAIPTLRLARLFTSALREHLPEVRVILTLRGDLLAQYASLERARALGQWHALSDKTRSDVPTIELERYAFADYLVRAFEVIQELESLRESHDVLTFRYERDIDGPEGVDASKLYDFVGLPHVEPEWLRSKKMSPSAKTYVSNYGAMRALVDDMEALWTSGATTTDLRKRYGSPTSRRLMREAQKAVSRTGKAARRIARILKTP